MLKEKTVTCIVCPTGCRIKVTFEDKKIKEIAGNQCKRGFDYAKEEVISPKRMLTTTVFLENGELLPVKTEKPIPKELLFKAMEELKNVRVKPPVRMGDVIKENIAGTGINIIASRSYN
ncbi:DUF1667 domain-containing protein [Thermovenabulum gondwanense]|uniref:4Fe-4S Mo/W bis-MGD-type domain-containing protein n=1 Tax=Thermovenabulum gondwanense TaxID=520767 RepID=A0A162MEF4_9FIRM|nr:DUF1667 domain-containing protein [Thermovenabulum gondwanense]KYO65476.1 hypothetical protein ATZ99_15120 [Thermovenabulum gondwanense]